MPKNVPLLSHEHHVRHLAQFPHLTVVSHLSHLPSRTPPVPSCTTCVSGGRPTDHPMKPETSAALVAKRIPHQCRGGPSHGAVDRHRLLMDKARAVRGRFDFLRRRYGHRLRWQLGRTDHRPFTGARERGRESNVWVLILGVLIRFDQPLEL